MRLQSSPDVMSIMMQDAAAVVALEVDAKALAGTGNEQPTGVINTANVGTFSGSSLDSVGLLNAQADVAAANALSANCGFVTTPDVAKLLMARPELPSTGTDRIWKGNLSDGEIFGFRAMSSQQMPSGTMIFGSWDQFVIGEFGAVELAISENALTGNFGKGIVSVRCFYAVDIGVRWPAAFSVATSIN